MRLPLLLSNPESDVPDGGGVPSGTSDHFKSFWSIGE